jgi:hypothetical protein
VVVTGIPKNGIFSIFDIFVIRPPILMIFSKPCILLSWNAPINPKNTWMGALAHPRVGMHL